MSIDVLIVEDDPMVAELNKSYLQMVHGFQLIGVVPNGEEALKIIQQQPVSLLLLDVFMPKMDGLKLLRQIRMKYPKTDIIMVTAARQTQDIQTALGLGVIDYIVKPFTFERFQMALTAYKERVRILSSENELDQALLDKNFLSKAVAVHEHLPKGIDAQTLKTVQEAIVAHGKDFTVNDIVPAVGLSRISLKKYVDYLEESGSLKSTMFYPAVGRPSKKYAAVKFL